MKVAKSPHQLAVELFTPPSIESHSFLFSLTDNQSRQEVDSQTTGNTSKNRTWLFVGIAVLSSSFSGSNFDKWGPIPSLVLAGTMAAKTHDFTYSLILATIVLLIGMGTLATGAWFTNYRGARRSVEQ
ncbi:hypothetical protein [Effusibacillus lacus]|uniref:hypothetical protein n=1 Tax=Effusibacillus lacus TaxID=1348429 RepID=UPI000BB800A8|nr:hypothetical protein [Effusibacillus lacus]